MLGAVVERHLTKLERVALVAKNAAGFDPGLARSADKRALWTYSLLDAQGAAVRPEDRLRMASDGLSEADVEAVQEHLAMLRINELVPTKHHVLRQLIEGVAATPTAANIDVAQGTYFRGLKLALAEIDRRYGGQRVEDGDFVDRILLSRSDPRLQVSSVAGGREGRDPDPPTADLAPKPEAAPIADFSKFAEELIKLNAKNGRWDQKTQRQARSISNLFVKFMIQNRDVHDLNSLRQAHAGKFVDFLLFEIYQNYGKSPKDERRTIAQLRERGKFLRNAAANDTRAADPAGGPASCRRSRPSPRRSNGGYDLLEAKCNRCDWSRWSRCDH
jgi:hypothetical protein